MRIIELNAANWLTPLDFYNALLAGLGAPKEHGRNLNALTESMVWGGMNSVEPPYTIRICDAGNLPEDVIRQINLAKHAVAEARADYRVRKGQDIIVEFEIMA